MSPSTAMPASDSPRLSGNAALVLCALLVAAIALVESSTAFALCVPVLYVLPVIVASWTLQGWPIVACIAAATLVTALDALLASPVPG
ncbi:MAG: hypothetical protein RLW42_24415, partial [Gammaproteobacteria bacterium]